MAKRFRPFWQGGRQVLSLVIADPLGCVGKAKLTVLVLCQLTDEALVPPYIQDARHGFGAALRAGGGVISTEQPRVART